jgi:hypothetical protein
MKLIELLEVCNQQETMQITIDGKLIKTFIPINLLQYEVEVFNIQQVTKTQSVYDIATQTNMVLQMNIILKANDNG